MNARCDVDFCTGDCLGCKGPMNDEAKDLQARFFEELKRCTADGQNKRANHSKPPWYIDPGHEAAMYRHLEVYEAGEKFDPDSGAHPLVAVAWRALAIACRERGNVPRQFFDDLSDGFA